MKDFRDQVTCKLLFYTLVRTKLEYASIVWSPIYNIHISNLENIQRKFLKAMHLKYLGSYPSRGFPQESLLSMFDADSLLKRRIGHSQIFLYKLLNNKIDCPSLLAKLNFHVPRINARQSDFFSIPLYHSNILRQSPLVQMMVNYNEHSHHFDIFNSSECLIKKVFRGIENL